MSTKSSQDIVFVAARRTPFGACIGGGQGVAVIIEAE